MLLYHFGASIFQDSVSYEIILYINNHIVSSGRPFHLHDNFLSLYKHVNFSVKLASLLRILEPDSLHD